MRALTLPLLRPACAAALLLAAALGPLNARSAPSDIKWKKTVLDSRFRAEGVAVADVNRDGKKDVLAGAFWYEAPNWKPHEIRPVEEFNGATGYSNCFLCFAADVDGDRWPDLVNIGFPGKPATWFRNPGRRGSDGSGHWQEFPITSSACNESPSWEDVDGDGKPELVTPFNESQMAYYRPGPNPREAWKQTIVSEPKSPGCARYAHGLGVGDVNGDRRADIIITEGFWAAPENRASTPWKWVPAKLGPACAQMHSHDFDGDGDTDVITSSAHAIGVWWWEQVPGASGPEFRQHVIDNTFSQSHALVKVDLNRDGQPDFVTGKRFWAHGPNGDVNPGDPAMLYWFEFRREDGKVRWLRHEIDNDSGVGTQFTVTDVNGDRKPDIAIANKKGVFLFEQVRR